MNDRTMTLLELEQRLQRMREQGAHDYTPVWLDPMGSKWMPIEQIRVYMPPMNQGRRAVIIDGGLV